MIIFRKCHLDFHVIVFLAVLEIFTGCEYHEIRIAVKDKYGQPVPGAIIYVESFEHSGTIDFAYIVAKNSVMVPDDENAPLKIQRSFCSKVAVAILAEGKQPIALYDHLGGLKPETMEYVLENIEHDYDGKPKWEGRLGALGFPFEKQPKIAERLKRNEYRPLIQAFRQAYTGLEYEIKRSRILPHEKKKYEFLKALLK